MSCWLKEVEAERGAAEAVVEERPIERVDVAEDSWKEVEGEQDRTPGGDVGSRQAPQLSRSIVGFVSVQSRAGSPMWRVVSSSSSVEASGVDENARAMEDPRRESPGCRHEEKGREATEREKESS